MLWGKLRTNLKGKYLYFHVRTMVVDLNLPSMVYQYKFVLVLVLEKSGYHLLLQ